MRTRISAAAIRLPRETARRKRIDHEPQRQLSATVSASSGEAWLHPVTHFQEGTTVAVPFLTFGHPECRWVPAPTHGNEIRFRISCGGKVKVVCALDKLRSLQCGPHWATPKAR